MTDQRAMRFPDLVTDAKSQIGVVLAAPIPFLLVTGLMGVAIFWIVNWHLRERLDSLQEQIATLEGRLKLRDDEITHLRTLVEANAGASDAAEKNIAVVPEPRAIPEHAERTPPDRDYFLPWRVYVPPVERMFVDYASLVELLFSLRDATSARRAAMMQPFLRKWVRLDVLVADVDVRNEETCVSSSIFGDGSGFLWLHFTRDRGPLAHLARDDAIALEGWVEEITRSSLRLYGCERL